MEKNWKLVDGHIVVKNYFAGDLPVVNVTLESGKTTYRFRGSYVGEHSVPAKMLRLMEKDGDSDGEKPGKS